MNTIAANTVLIGHTTFLGAMTLAPVLVNNEEWLENLQFTIPVIGASWLLNDGKCILSDIENKLRGTPPGQNFYQTLASKVGLKMTVKQSNILGYGMLAAGWVITRWRLRRMRARKAAPLQ